ncbi:MAG: YvrJ family protein [Aerococcaceae bacterium]|nr:YvrJ family protein [Aerococcaceae bacterium]
MEEVVNLIGNFGFPIALVFYFLLRFEKKIDELSHSLSNLSTQINLVLAKKS